MGPNSSLERRLVCTSIFLSSSLFSSSFPSSCRLMASRSRPTTSATISAGILSSGASPATSIRTWPLSSSGTSTSEPSLPWKNPTSGSERSTTGVFQRTDSTFSTSPRTSCLRTTTTPGGSSSTATTIWNQTLRSARIQIPAPPSRRPIHGPAAFEPKVRQTWITKKTRPTKREYLSIPRFPASL